MGYIMQSKLSDIELIEQTLAGNQAAYADLVKRHQRFVFTLALRFCKNREDAEEVAQADRRGDLAAEHRELMDLTLARNADAAIEALVHHIKGTPERLITYAREHGLDDLNGPSWQAH